MKLLEYHCRIAFLAVVTLTGSVLAQAPASGPQSFNVQGIGPGDTIDSALSKLGTSYKVIKATLGDSGLTAAKATKGDWREPKAAMDTFSFEALDGKLVYIQRSLKFAEGQEPNSDDTLNRLNAKYGQWTGRQGSWVLDPQGKPLLNIIQAAKCQLPFRSSDSMLQAFDGPPGERNITILNGGGMSPFCGLVVRADLDVPQPPKLKDLNIYMLDQRPFIPWGAKMAAKDKAEQQKKIDSTKRNKAPL